MSKFLTPRNIVIGAGAGAIFLFAPGIYGNMFRTPGVKNIENRFTAGGAAPDGKPAVATRRGACYVLSMDFGLGRERMEE